jgi:hypothetical protein
VTRKPLRERYDAFVGLAPGQDIPEFAFGLVKFTYTIGGGVAALTEPEPLLHDVWGPEALEPRLPVGSDFWFQKVAADVVVRGSAFNPGGSPIETARVLVSIGERAKRIAVFGHRVVSWRKDGTPEFSSPEPVESVPLVYQLAYGGFDARVPIPEDDVSTYMQLLRAGLAYDHPGLYPRNPVGKGYVVLPGPIDGLELPNLEDPYDMLTPERLVTRAPEYWYRQPLPWCFEWSVGSTFPRFRFLGGEPWFPPPDGPELPEVARGFCPPGLRGLTEDGPEMPGYLQEASLGMSFLGPLAGQPVRLEGMNPDHPSIGFAVPPPPRLVFEVEGARESVEARLTNFVVHPKEMRFTVTYAAKTAALPRAFIPGVHREIPIALLVDDEPPIRYQAPETMMDRLRATDARNAPQPTMRRAAHD